LYQLVDDIFKLHFKGMGTPNRLFQLRNFHFLKPWDIFQAQFLFVD